MGDENLIRTLGDYSRPNHEGYRNTIELPDGNNVVSLRSDTIRLVQNGCSFHGHQSEDPNQHLKDFLKLERIEKTKRSKNDQKPTRNGKKTKRQRARVKNQPKITAGSARFSQRKK
ncbi:hypothetical protein Tco_0194052 [Tanacetum coccineum]